MQTVNIPMTGAGLRVADGAGDVTFRPARAGAEWVVQPAAWVADASMVGHATLDGNVSMRLIAGESLWVRGPSTGVAVITADTPVV